MKTSTRNAYAQRIDRVVERLQQAVARGGELPDLAELAAVAHLSPFHFHRVWRALTGETVGGTVLRLRLLRALHLLTDPQAIVTEVASATGYETAQAFARAFRDATGGSPSELRGQSEQIEEAISRLEKPPHDEVATQVALPVEVVSVEPFEVVALRNRGAFADLDRAYGRLFGWAAEAGLVERIIGLHGVPLADHRDVPPADLEFDCSIRLSAIADPPSPLRLARIGGGDYARLRHVGSFDTLEDVVDRVLIEWLPISGYALRDAPIHYDYHDDPEVVPEALLRSDIFVPVAMEAQP
jgi:AraC family transcriptional regulator